MTFHCSLCNYSTENQYSWKNHKYSKLHSKNSIKTPNTHLNSPKLAQTHLNDDTKSSIPTNITEQFVHVGSSVVKENTELVCNYCGLKCARNFNLVRHMNKCPKKTNEIEKIEADKEVAIIKTKLEATEKQLQIIEKHLVEKNDEIEFNKRLVASLNHMVASGDSGKNGQNSISAVKYLLVNHTKAPPLKAITDQSYLSKGQPPLTKGDTKQFVKTIINAHRNKMLHKLLGDIIIKVYQCDNIQEQSLFNSDPTRLTYISRGTVDNILSWISDKNGKVVANTAIAPLLKYVSEISQAYSKEISEKLKTNLDNDNENDQFDEITDQNIAIAEIKKEINNKILQEKINKYIAPFFYLKDRGVKFESVKLLEDNSK